MTTSILIVLCILVLVAYVFDLTSGKTRIPSVILLLLTGWGMQQVSHQLNLSVPDMTPALSLLGTVGLILIVLEGSLELELNSTKIPVIKKSAWLAAISIVLLSASLAFAFHYNGSQNLRSNLINALPFTIISSAIAIPSTRTLNGNQKEFIVYESSLSDILGVLVFNFLTVNTMFSPSAFGWFFIQIVIMLLISVVATAGLSYLLSKIEHHVKFIPIILLVVFVYAVSKYFQLPGLIFILILGLSLGNIKLLDQFHLLTKSNSDALIQEIQKFKEINAEGTFLIRALFFLLFGFLIEIDQLLNTNTLVWAAGICAGIYLLRIVLLRVGQLSLLPLLFMAPRGLITILLFLTIGAGDAIHLVNKALVTQVIVITAIFMMIGLITNTPTNDK